MISFTFCLITKNEAKIIAKCLKPLAETGMEIVVLDTGSTDQTVSIARQYTRQIYHFNWINDFSAARNYAIEKSSNDYVLFIDSDEIIENIDIVAIQKSIQNYPNAIGRLKRRNLCRNGNSTNIMIDYVERLFDRRQFGYEGRIHEQVTSRIGSKLLAYEIPLTVFHEGYLGTPEEVRAKAIRNNSILLEELQITPNDPYLYYQLGQSYDLCEDPERAYDYYSQGYALHPDLTLEYVKVMVVSYGYSMIATGRLQEAVGLRSCYSSLGNYADYVCMLGDAYLHLNLTLAALKEFKHALTLGDFHVEGSNNAIPAHNLGCIYEAYGNTTTAVYYYQKAISAGHSSSRERLLALQENEIYTGLAVSKKMCLIVTGHCSCEELRNFLTSVEEQTIGLDHLMLIGICDAEQSPVTRLLRQYEKQYSDSVLLVQIEQKVAFGDSCHIALEYAGTDYIAFFTGREYLHPEYCRQIIQTLQSHPAEILCCNVTNQPLDLCSITEDGESALYHLHIPSQQNAFLHTERSHKALQGHVFTHDFLQCHKIDFSAYTGENAALFCNTYRSFVSTYLWFNVTLLSYPSNTTDSIV